MLEIMMTRMFLLYAKILKDWGFIMIALIITVRIVIEVVKPFFKLIWKNIIDSGKLVVDISEDKSLTEEEISEKIWGVICGRKKQLFIYPLFLIVSALGLYKTVAVFIKCWIEMSANYTTTILLPWINNIHMIDRHYILPLICLISNVIVELYERYSIRIKKKLRSMVIIIIVTMIETIILCKMEVGTVFILLILQLCGIIYKVRYDKVVYDID